MAYIPISQRKKKEEDKKKPITTGYVSVAERSKSKIAQPVTKQISDPDQCHAQKKKDLKVGILNGPKSWV